MPNTRASSRVYTSADGIIARAGRAHEDPVAMTTDATLGRLAKHMIAVYRMNPDLDDKQLAKAARLRLRAEMADLARKSAAARRGLVLDATGLEDAGSDGVDAD